MREKKNRSGALPRMILLAIVAATILRGEAPVDVNVCELLANLAKWHGRMVRVSGVLGFNRETSTGIIGEHCPVGVVIKEYEFDKSIVLANPEQRSDPRHVVDFVLDRASDAILGSLLKNLQPDKERIRSTVIGMFETKLPLESMVVRSPAGFPVGVGFGNGDIPAQILVKTLTDMRIEKKSDR